MSQLKVNDIVFDVLNHQQDTVNVVGKDFIALQKVGKISGEEIENIVLVSRPTLTIKDVKSGLDKGEVHLQETNGTTIGHARLYWYDEEYWIVLPDNRIFAARQVSDDTYEAIIDEQNVMVTLEP